MGWDVPGSAATGLPSMCIRGIHQLGPRKMTVTWNHLLRLPSIICNACRDARDRRAKWSLVDTGRAYQHAAATAQELGLQIVATPPDVPAGVGQIAVWVDGRPVSDADVMLCGRCHTGVIEHARTDEQHRRRGFAWTCVAAALARGPGYAWSTTLLAKNTSARQFWYGIGFDRWATVGEPNYCPHMRKSWQQTPG